LICIEHSDLVFPADCLHRRIVTACLTRRRVVRQGRGEYRADTQVFQHTAKFYNYDWFIVTAAVYRGFGRELRLAANPLP
jgi:hypothetical protein